MSGDDEASTFRVVCVCDDDEVQRCAVLLLSSVFDTLTPEPCITSCIYNHISALFSQPLQCATAATHALGVHLDSPPLHHHHSPQAFGCDGHLSLDPARSRRRRRAAAIDKRSISATEEEFFPLQFHSERWKQLRSKSLIGRARMSGQLITLRCTKEPKRSEALGTSVTRSRSEAIRSR